MKNPSNEKNIDKLKQAGLKVTHSRCKILEIFHSFPGEHYTADRLKDLLDDQGENIGLATIYRVLTQLEMAELIQKNNFNDNLKKTINWYVNNQSWCELVMKNSSFDGARLGIKK